jgi:quercetin dioxygenase-like cupin family protein
MSSQLAGICVHAGDAETIRSPLGGDVTFLARGSQTDGAMSVFRVVVPAGSGPPLHVHDALDEAIYVLDGDVRWRLGEELLAAPAGSLVFVPRGLAHCFQNTGTEPATMLITFTPAGMEGFFERQADLAEFDLDVFRAAAAQEGMEVVGPPLAQSDPL